MLRDSDQDLPQLIAHTWVANHVRAIVFLAALFATGGAALQAQNGHPSEASLMPQLRQALSLNEHGDRQGAMNLVLNLLEQRPDFAQAIKLKGMLLEESGRASEAAAAYEQA
ncbi:MAG: hypothetical protein ABSF93_20685, partial [Candidatus Sulfotelmatobacter sp.]